MIFITLGSQKFQFNRLLKEVDRLIEQNKITDEVFAQIGYSDYKPKNYRYKEFLDRQEFSQIMSRCNKVITHGGTGAIIGALKNKKKVMAIPRLKLFGEHIDNHQIQIVTQFKEMNLIVSITNISDMENALSELESKVVYPYISNTHSIINSIEEYIINK